MNKDGTPETMEEFCDWASRTLHDALLVGGAKNMRATLWIILPSFLHWQADMKKKRK